MIQTQNSRKYDLNERTLEFAKRVIAYVKKMKNDLPNKEIGKQLLRSGCSVGANYIEAEDALSKKDFVMRIKISRKEAKETIYWLKLSEPENKPVKEQEQLIQEATELMKIFGSIVSKSK